MTKEHASLEHVAATLGLTGGSPVSIAPLRARIGRTDKILLAGACCVLAALSAAASVWLVIPVLVVSGLLASMLAHALNERHARETAQDGVGAPPFQNDIDPLAEHSRVMQAFEDETTELTTNPAYKHLSCNLRHDIRLHR